MFLPVTERVKTENAAAAFYIWMINLSQPF